MRCPNCGEENPERARFCGNCGFPLAEAVPSRPEERKVVTALFCDLADFTERSDLADPEDVKATLRPFHELLKREIERFGGTLDKFVGDGALGVFGAPTVHEDDPERAVRAALGIQQAIRDLNEADPALAMAARVGIATGVAVVALGAGPQIGESVTGDVVNTASRLQSVAPPGSIAVAGPTHDLTSEAFDYAEIGPVMVKGKSQPIMVWRPLAPRSQLPLGPEVRHRYEAAFTGRAPELSLLEALYRWTVRRSSVQLVTVTGQPGIGKSRLIQEFRSSLERLPEAPRWLQGRCLPYGEGITFWPLGEIVKGAAGILESDSAQEARAKLRDAITELIAEESERAWLRARLGPLVGLGSGVTAERQELFTAWRRFLEGVAARGPLVIGVEDLAWADEAMLEFLEHLVQEASGEPILVVAAARSDLYERYPHWGGGIRNSTTVPLSPLTEAETTSLISSLLERSSFPAPIQAMLLERAGGNPLYTEEFVRMLRDRGLMEAHGELVGDLSEVTFPDSLQAIIAARLDSLHPEHKALLQDAAVIGKVFWSRALAAMGDRDPEAVEEGLHELVTKDLIHRSGDSSVKDEEEYAFLHLLVRDVAYAQIPRAARADRHRRAAAWIEQLAGERVTDHAEVLVYHAMKTLELAKAAGQGEGFQETQDAARRYLLLAGRRALALDVSRAEAHLRAALELSPPGDAREAEVLGLLAQAAFNAGRLEEAERLSERAVEELSSQNREVEAADAKVNLFGVLQYRGETARARGLLAEATEVLERRTPGPELARALTETVGTFMSAGRFRDAVVAADRAIALARDVGEVEQEIRALGFRGYSRVGLGDAAGLEEERTALADALRIGLGRSTAVIYNNLAVNLGTSEGPAQALECYREGIAFAQARGLQEMVAWMRMTSLLPLIDVGDWAEVLRAGADVAEAARSSGAGYDEAFAQSLRVYVLAQRGSPEVREVLEWLLPRAREIGDPQVLVGVLAAAAVAEADSGPLTEANGHGEAAAAFVRDARTATASAGSDILAWYLPDLVRVAAAAGDVGLARDLSAGIDPTLPRYRNAVQSAAAVMAEAAGDLDSAERSFAGAAQGWTEFGHVLERGHALFGRGRCLIGLGSDTDGAEPLREARTVFTSLGAGPLVAKADRWLGLIATGAGRR